MTDNPPMTSTSPRWSKTAGDDALPTVSVVIPTRNRRESLARTLAGLRGEAGLSELIVVDDGSDDDTASWLDAQARRWPALKSVRTAGIGSNPARAAGVERATGEVVVFLDDDEVPVPGLVAAHARHHQDREGIVVCGYCPVVLKPDASSVMRLIARWWEEAVEAIEADPSQGLFRLWAGNFSMRRRDLARVPLSNTDFEGRKNHGDRDFGLRCHRAGLGYVFDRALRVDHFYTRSLGQFRREARSSGYGTVLVHHLHPDLLGPVPPHFVDSDNSLLSRVLRLTDRKPFYLSCVWTLGALVRLNDRVGFGKGGELALRLLHRIERRHGARECVVSFESGEIGENKRGPLHLPRCESAAASARDEPPAART